MTCKFCGSTIDDNLVECPYCGHKTGVSAPADPAAEMTEQFAAQESQDKNDAKSAKTSSKRGKALGSIGSALSNGINKAKSGTSGNKTGAKSSAARNGKSPVSGNGLIAIGLIACLLLCLISIISVAGMKKDLENMNQEMLSLFYQIQNSTDKLQKQVDALERSIGNVSTTITEQTTSKNITITKDPTSVATYVGRGGDDDVRRTADSQLSEYQAAEALSESSHKSIYTGHPACTDYPSGC